MELISRRRAFLRSMKLLSSVAACAGLVPSPVCGVWSWLPPWPLTRGRLYGEPGVLQVKKTPVPPGQPQPWPVPRGPLGLAWPPARGLPFGGHDFALQPLPSRLVDTGGFFRGQARASYSAGASPVRPAAALPVTVDLTNSDPEVDFPRGGLFSCSGRHRSCASRSRCSARVCDAGPGASTSPEPHSMTQ